MITSRKGKMDTKSVWNYSLPLIHEEILDIYVIDLELQNIKQMFVKCNVEGIKGIVNFKSNMIESTRIT